MRRIVGSIVSLAHLHLITVASDPEQYRPLVCPHCRRADVWRHGCYHRKADRTAGAAASLNPVRVLRFLCRACVRTCSRLPACMAPRRWCDWIVQQAVLVLLLGGMSLHGCARCSGRDRRTVRRWRWRDWLRYVFSPSLEPASASRWARNLSPWALARAPSSAPGPRRSRR